MTVKNHYTRVLDTDIPMNYSADIDSKTGHDSESSSWRICEATNPTSLGQVYKFMPNKNYPKLRLCSERRHESPLKAIIRKSIFVIVTDQTDNNWWQVSINNFSGWLYVPVESIKEGVFKKVEEIKLYESWPGNNYFFLGGRIMLGADGPFFM